MASSDLKMAVAMVRRHMACFRRFQALGSEARGSRKAKARVAGAMMSVVVYTGGIKRINA